LQEHEIFLLERQQKEAEENYMRRIIIYYLKQYYRSDISETDGCYRYHTWKISHIHTNILFKNRGKLQLWKSGGIWENNIKMNLENNTAQKHNRPLWVAVQGLIRPTPYTTLHKKRFGIMFNGWFL
jgi:hypothetical protein